MRRDVYLGDNASINSFPVENRPAHKYLCWVFSMTYLIYLKKRGLRMSKVIGDSHRWGFVPNNFGETRSHCYFGALYNINLKAA